jgi:hypothetical protein
MSADVWPQAELGPLARLRVLAEGLPGTVLHEATIDGSFDRVWGWARDLERSIPTFDRLVASVRIVRREARPGGDDRLRVVTRGTGRGCYLPMGFDVDLGVGWCWMVSRPRGYVVGMAAEPDGDRTRWGQLEGIALSTPGLFRPLLRATRWRHRRHVGHDVEGIQRAIGRS